MKRRNDYRFAIRHIQLFALGVACLGMASISMAGNEYVRDALPKDDPHAESWFGVWRSEPIWTGWLFVDGQYVDAPYVLEQRGYFMFVNGHLCGKALIDRDLFPTMESFPLNEEPPMPTNITEDAPPGSISMVITDHIRYWKTMELSRDEFMRRYVEFLKAMPCIKSLKEGGGMGHGERSMWVEEKNGSNYEIGFGRPNYVYRLDPPPPPRESLMPKIEQRKKGILTPLRMGLLCITENHSLNGFGPPPKVTPNVEQIKAVAHLDAPIQEKAERFRALQFLIDDTEYLTTWDKLVLKNFRGTPQFWKRLAGDESWKEDAMKTFVPEPEGTVVEPTFGKGQPIPEPPPSRLSPSTQPKPKPASAPTVPEPAPEAPARAFSLPLVAAGVAALSLTAFLLLRRRKA